MARVSILYRLFDSGRGWCSLQSATMLAVLEQYGLYEAKYSALSRIKVLCPFHEDVNPSMSVDIESSRFYCFGCGAKGDTIDLVSKLEGVSRLKAMVMCKKLASGIIETFDVAKEVKQENPIRQAKEFFFSLPKMSWASVKRHYLLSRGFTTSTLEAFDVRINQSVGYPIIIPIRDNGRFKGYVCRRSDDGEPKYLYNRGFARKSVLAGTHNGDVVFVVEGMLDAMKAKQHGVNDVCALLGWDCSEAQAEALNKASHVVCALDNDAAGEKGYQKLLQVLTVPVHRFVYPKGAKDMCDIDKATYARVNDSLLQIS